ncbi:MAG: hypothetical protein IJC56_04895 [Clostridia bacterium]|nr:hypothetical protein [Clostridia bacterium]
MSRTEAKARRKPISIINWMLTIILSIIPGVNIIGFIAMMIFAKNRSKKTFAAAALILCVLAAILFIAAFLFFGNKIVELVSRLNA